MTSEVEGSEVERLRAEVESLRAEVWRLQRACALFAVAPFVTQANDYPVRATPNADVIAEDHPDFRDERRDGMMGGKSRAERMGIADEVAAIRDRVERKSKDLPDGV